MSIGDTGRREPPSGRFPHLQSLPRGFRFHPTDDELINHYLKGKIDGTLSSDPEVIPEVDVCKCEPWDLPDRSLIRSADPEWFFFAPRDRKYANGHRSNRATAAGYWKATGKDRVIRSRPLGVVGMKKTLVFHSGRAPKGSRTNWIMHEYRTTQDEYEAGEQGGYVLYRLFKKFEDRSSSPNLDAVERSDLSPTPPKPSPSDTQQEPDASEEFATPVNEDTPQSGMHEVQQSLASIVNSQPSVMERGLADKSDCSTTSPVKLEKIVCNDIMSSDKGVQKAGVEGKVDSLMNVLLQSSDPRFEWTDSDGFPTISSPVLPYADYPFFGSNDQGSLLELYGDGNPQDDSLNKLLSTALSNQDDYSAEYLYPLETPFSEMGPDANAATACIPIWNSAHSINGGWGSDVDKNAGLLQRSTNLEYSVWSGRPPVLSNGYSEMNPNVSNVYENTGYLSHDIPGKDIYSASESLQELVNDMNDPSCRRFSNNNGDGLVRTGIKIMAREPQNLPNSSTAMHLNGESRIRLQRWTDVETSCDGTTSNFNKDDNENKGPEVEEEKHQENDNAERSFSCESDESNNREDNEDKVVASEDEDKTGNNDSERSISCKSTGSSTTADHLEVNGAKIVERDNVEDCNGEEVSGPVDLDKLKDFSIIDDSRRNTTLTSASMLQETEPTLRIRRKWNVIAGCRLNTSSLQQKAPNALSVVAYLTGSVPVMTILLLLSAGIWRCLGLYYF